jgi:alcohol dehydrogenase class IV
MPFFDVGSQFLGFDLGAYNGEIRPQTGLIAPTPPRPTPLRMTTIALDRLPRIVQGAGALSTVGTLVAELVAPGSAVLLVADPGLRGTGMIDGARAALREAGFGVVLFDDVKSDPTMAQVDAAAGLARREKATAVVSIGGGSALDVGKTVAAICGGEPGASHYGLCANPFPKSSVANVCIPTTSGTGSETTRTAVLADAAHAKIWLWGEEIKADVVVLDPVLTTGLPAHLTAATGVDALVHAIEAATNANANPANNLYCHEAIRLVVKHLRRAVEKPADVEARGGVQWAATLAGIAIDNCGTAIAHNIGHALASLRPIHHGRVVGLALRATLPWNIENDDGCYAAVAAAMGESASATMLPGAFDRLVRDVGIKVSLSGEGHDGITAEQLAAQMARPENSAMRRSNRRSVADSDLLHFANLVLTES